MNAIRASLNDDRRRRPAPISMVKESSMPGTDPKMASSRMQMKALAERSMRYGQMIVLLERIERLQSITEKIESSISDKKYKEAYELLQEGLRILKDNDLDDIVAIQSIKQYLKTQERALYNVMDFERA